MPSFGVRLTRSGRPPPLTCAVVWKRKKGVKYLGSVHGGELPEFYGMSQEVTDKVALDSICEFGSRNLRPRCYYETERPFSSVVCQLPESHPTKSSLLWLAPTQYDLAQVGYGSRSTSSLPLQRQSRGDLRARQRHIPKAQHRSPHSGSGRARRINLFSSFSTILMPRPRTTTIRCTIVSGRWIWRSFCFS